MRKSGLSLTKAKKTNNNKTEFNKTNNNNMVFAQEKGCPDNGDEEDQDDVVVDLINIGIASSTAQDLLSTYGTAIIRAKLDLLSRQKTVQNPAGFLFRALRDNYIDYHAIEKQQRLQCAAKQKQIQLAAEKKLAEEQAAACNGIPVDSPFRQFLPQKMGVHYEPPKQPETEEEHYEK